MTTGTPSYLILRTENLLKIQIGFSRLRRHDKLNICIIIYGEINLVLIPVKCTKVTGTLKSQNRKFEKSLAENIKILCGGNRGFPAKRSSVIFC